MFIGRENEIAFCENLIERNQAAILIVHGRRRVGKTSLVEKVFSQRGLIKLEGLENGAPKAQLYSAVQQLAPYFPKVPVTSWRPRTWGDFFRLLAPLLVHGTWTLFLEEYQWLSGYKTSLTAELKIAWDNIFSKNSKLIIILCGSSPAFMVGKVLRSKALHNRSQYELAVKPLPFSDAKRLLPKQRTTRDAFDAYLLVGGIPEYLNRIAPQSSMLLGLWREFSSPSGFFKDEFNRIIVSSLSENPLYGKVIKALACVRYATRLELAKKLKVEPGGSFSQLLQDLEASGFIASYHPIDRPTNSLLCRYRIADPFLRTYFSFLKLQSSALQAAPPIEKLKAHLGHAFENYCREHAAVIAKLLEFSGIQYTAGSYFSRVVERELKGFQVDLVFQRADRVLTLCEIKYTDAPVGSEIIRAFERTLGLYREIFPNTIQRVLISAAGVTPSLKDKAVFDQVITLDDLLLDRSRKV